MHKFPMQVGDLYYDSGDPQIGMYAVRRSTNYVYIGILNPLTRSKCRWCSAARMCVCLPSNRVN